MKKIRLRQAHVIGVIGTVATLVVILAPPAAQAVGTMGMGSMKTMAATPTSGMSMAAQFLFRTVSPGVTGLARVWRSSTNRHLRIHTSELQTKQAPAFESVGGSA
jgi:hypothetical protein